MSELTFPHMDHHCQFESNCLMAQSTLFEHIAPTESSQVSQCTATTGTISLYSYFHKSFHQSVEANSNHRFQNIEITKPLYHQRMTSFRDTKFQSAIDQLLASTVESNPTITVTCPECNDQIDRLAVMLQHAKLHTEQEQEAKGSNNAKDDEFVLIEDVPEPTSDTNDTNASTYASITKSRSHSKESQQQQKSESKPNKHFVKQNMSTNKSAEKPSLSSPNNKDQTTKTPESQSSKTPKSSQNNPKTKQNVSSNFYQSVISVGEGSSLTADNITMVCEDVELDQDFMDNESANPFAAAFMGGSSGGVNLQGTTVVNSIITSGGAKMNLGNVVMSCSNVSTNAFGGANANNKNPNQKK